MMYATAGNLDSFLLTRSHSTEPTRPDLSAGGIADAESLGQLPKAERIKAFKKRRMSKGGNTKKEENRGVLLLGLEEIVKLFGDVVEGLAFLVGFGIGPYRCSHKARKLDLAPRFEMLKCAVTLGRRQTHVSRCEESEEVGLISSPKAMISDFGTSEEMLRGKRDRTGHTGTMEYMAPETIVTDPSGRWRPSDSHADMWSLGPSFFSNVWV